MKQNGGTIRLVQRKFAQGVPIPPSINVAPPAPERKPDPPRDDQRNVYHNGMSARSLLDIVALQNVHKHKQPMVLLERLREDEIPVTAAPKLPVKKRCLAVKPSKKIKKKNKMCLRPREELVRSTRKRKSGEIIKVASKKRGRASRDERSSTTEDDMPLLYLSNSTKEKPPEKVKTEDRSFTFKRPSNASIASYRKFKRNAKTAPLASGRPLASPVPLKLVARRSNRRAGAPAPPAPAAPAPRAARRLPVRHKIVKPKKKTPKPVELACTEPPLLQEVPSSVTAPVEAETEKWDDIPIVDLTTPSVTSDSSDVCELRYESESAAPTPTPTPMPTRTPTPAPAEPVEPAPSPCPSNRYNSVQEVVVASNAQCSELASRCLACHGCTIVNKIIQLTRLVRPVCSNAGDVYDFNAEVDETMSPSLPSLRHQSRRARAAEEESHLYLDLLPRHSPHIIQITSKRTAERQCISIARIVSREVMSNSRQPSLIEHENLLDKLLECLSVESQGQAPAQGQEEPQPSSSRLAVCAADTAGSDGDRASLTHSVDLGVKIIYQEGLDSTSDIVDLAQESTTDSTTSGSGKVLEAPIFYPTEEEFMDPIVYYDKIAPIAKKYGLCKIVAPAGFKPPCVMNDNIRFAVIYQYISKLYSRWGPVSRELAAIKAHLRTQSVVFARSPLLDGSEVNLPKLYHSVQRNGGPTKVIQRKRWARVAEEMKLTKLQNPERKLDQIYMRYLLPYATLSNQERQEKMADVEKCWTTKYQKMLERARNPFHRQKRLLGESESSEDEGEDNDTAGALHEAEDCIVQGRIMNLATFKKIATSLMGAHFEPESRPAAAAVEQAYWRAVLHGTEHIVANTASIDTGEEGYGFPKDPAAPYGDHPWNLKRLSQNPSNVLRFLGPVLGVTVPTLHLSMLFSTSCWHRDPHGLPWTEFMHSGPDKIWYGIPSEQSANFRRAVETLCPAYCQNKPIWLASDIAMIPPDILSEHDVTLSRVTQQPGEYVMVFPEAHSCSITTGFAISESVYFASNSWLDNVYKLFQELRNSCEPTMFSLEQLLLRGGRDECAPRCVLLPVCSVLSTLVGEELEHRRGLVARGLTLELCEAEAEPQPAPAWNARDQAECQFCRSTLYLSKIFGLTGRKSSVCPEHALRLLQSKKYKNVDVTTLRFVSAYSSSMLEDLLDKLERRVADEDKLPERNGAVRL